MNKRSPSDSWPPSWLAPLEAREPRLQRDRLIELTIIAAVGFVTTMGGLVAGGSWIFFTQREATVMRSDIAVIKTDVAILNAKFDDHINASVVDTPSRVASMYAAHPSHR